MTETRREFWTMVWEKNVGVIVALNKFDENAPRYWPDKNGAVIDYHPIRVEKLKTEKLEESLRTQAGASIGSSTTMMKAIKGGLEFLTDNQ